MKEQFYDPAAIATLQSVFRLVVPEAILLVFACALFLCATVRNVNRNVLAVIAMIGLTAALLAAIFGPGRTPVADLVPTVSTIWPDRLTYFTRLLGIIGCMLLILMSWDEAPDSVAGEYFACILLIAAGAGLTGAANELITLFLALELISIPTYVLLYLPRTDRPAQESAVKYFLLSIFSSGFLLLGFSYLYGLTGTTNIPALLDAFSGPEAPAAMLPLAAIVLIVAGLGFKITAVPFHFYAPDVYEGAPVSAAALLAFVPKLAGFVALIRILGEVGPGHDLLGSAYLGLTLKMQVPVLLWILAAITMTLGNVVALWQENLQRIMAYSSVAHAGYMLIGLAVAPFLVGASTVGGVSAVLFYLVAYGAMTLGVFGVLALLNRDSRQVERVDDLAGLGRTNPKLAALMALFLFSLIGLPLTAGFAGKLLIFFGAMTVPASVGDAGWLYLVLAIIAALNAAIGAYYYLRIIGVMYLRSAVHPQSASRCIAGWAVLVACAIFTIGFGVFPASMQEFTQAVAAAASPSR